ncbi:Glucokinase [compost metagenome]
MDYVIGIDVGGTNIVGALLDQEGQVLWSKHISTEAKLGVNGVIGRIVSLVRDVAEGSGKQLNDILAVGIGTPGLVDPIQGISLLSVNLEWKDVPLAALVSAELGIPVYVDNDVKMYIFGEAAKGAGANYKHVFGITLGTGLAAAYIENGEIIGGAGNLAGELGQVLISGIDAEGTGETLLPLEKVVSATGIADQAKRAIEAGDQGWLAQHYAAHGGVTAKNVSEAYDAGDETARGIMDHTGRVLGRALAWVIPMLSPDVIIIGGGAAYAGERLLAPMRDELQHKLTPLYHNRYDIHIAHNVDNAGVIGSGLRALALAKKADN